MLEDYIDFNNDLSEYSEDDLVNYCYSLLAEKEDIVSMFDDWNVKFGLLKFELAGRLSPSDYETLFGYYPHNTIN